MGSEIDTPGIEGRVITDGVAQSVYAEDGATHLRLTFMPGHETPASGVIPLPEPVTVGPGVLVVELEQLAADPGVPVPGRPLHIPAGMTVTKAILPLATHGEPTWSNLT